jgi:hypothetical protein
MNAWQWEIFEDVVNSAPCSVTNPGPLFAPIESLSIRRNEDRELILSTTAPDGAHSSATVDPPGTVRRNDEVIEFTTPTGFTAVGRGVTPKSWVRSHNMQTGSDTTREESSIYSLILTSQHGGQPQYTIDWIENFHAKSFLWFGNITDKSIETRVVGRGDDAITLETTSTGHAGYKACANLKVGGVDLYLGAPSSGGFILYKGTPAEATREKIRNCISFALGNFLVYLGCTVLDSGCNPMSITAMSGDRLNGRVSKVAVLPPAPLERRYEREVDPVIFSRLVNALYAMYDELQIGHLSWAYWHAVCAPVHIAAAHFGAAIEALQDAYIKAHPGDFQTKLVDEKKNWQQLQNKLVDVVKAAGFAADIEGTFTNKIRGLNCLPISKLSEQVFTHLGIRLGNLEKEAWRQRHIAAHGDLTADDPVATIKNTKLLRLIFHRLLLKMTNGSDFYRDYYTLNFPTKRLEESAS